MARKAHIPILIVGLGAGSLPSLPAQSTGLVASGGIIGRVIDQQSQLPLGGATVSLLGLQRQTSTDSSGRFTQAGLGPGTYLLEVRAIGYGVTSWLLRLKDGEVVDYVFEVAPLGVELEAVTIEGRPAFVANAELKVSFLRPVRIGSTLTCTAQVISGGRRLSFVEAEVVDDDDRLVLKASSTYVYTERD